MILTQKKLPIGTVIFYAGESWTDNSTLKGWYACIGGVVPDGDPAEGETITDLRDSFVMGSSVVNLGDVGGSPSVIFSHSHNTEHSHDILHCHGIPDHDHCVSHCHTHSGGSALSNYHLHAQNYYDSGSLSGCRAWWACSTGTACACVCPEQTSWVGEHTHSVSGDLTDCAMGVGDSISGSQDTCSQTSDVTTSQSVCTTDPMSNGLDSRPSYYSAIFIKRMS